MQVTLRTDRIQPYLNAADEILKSEGIGRINLETKRQTVGSVGSRVLVRTDALGDSPYWDVVRGVFTQTILRQPYAPNKDVEALVLTTRSWCKVSDALIVESKRG